MKKLFNKKMKKEDDDVAKAHEWDQMKEQAERWMAERYNEEALKLYQGLPAHKCSKLTMTSGKEMYVADYKPFKDSYAMLHGDYDYMSAKMELEPTAIVRTMRFNHCSLKKMIRMPFSGWETMYSREFEYLVPDSEIMVNLSNVATIEPVVIRKSLIMVKQLERYDYFECMRGKYEEYLNSPKLSSEESQ